MRKNTCFHALLVGALGLGLAACASDPIHHYTLVAPIAASSGAGAAGQRAAAPYQIEVLPVRIPEPLNRLALVVRQGPGEVAVVNTERWVGPLEDEIGLALSQNLSHRLNANDTGAISDPATLPVVKIKVDIRRLDAWLGHRVDLEANWSVYLAQSKAPRSLCRSAFEQPSEGSYSQLIGATQRALDQLAAQIAVAVDAAAGAGEVQCP